jgi:hypothetical protein
MNRHLFLGLGLVLFTLACSAEPACRKAAGECGPDEGRSTGDVTVRDTQTPDGDTPDGDTPDGDTSEGLPPMLCGYLCPGVPVKQCPCMGEMQGGECLRTSSREPVLTPLLQLEICGNQLDDNCDGVVDEDLCE